VHQNASLGHIKSKLFWGNDTDRFPDSTSDGEEDSPPTLPLKSPLHSDLGYAGVQCLNYRGRVGIGLLNPQPYITH